MITQNIIGFDLSAKSEKRLYAYNPALQENLPEDFVPATNEEVDFAMNKALYAWRIFRRMEVERRASFLIAIAEGIERLDDMLVNRVMLETAYSQARVLTERRRTVEQLRMFAEYIMQPEWRDATIVHAFPGRMPAPRTELRKRNIAIGPVVVFAASNFPLAYSTIGGDSTSALAAGCPVIVKAHESHLGTNALIAEVIMNAARETGMPDGVFSSLHGDGHDTGQQLVLHPHTAAVGFTGSLKGGRTLFDLGAKREKPIPVFAEMGSTNPVFLLPGVIRSDQYRLMKKLVSSMTMTVGQFCTNPGIIVALDEPATQQLLSNLAAELEAVPEEFMLNTNIAANYHKGVSEILKENEVNVISNYSPGDMLKAAPVLLSVKADVFLNRALLHREIFGPFSLVVLCTDFKQMLTVAHSLDGQLTATIHTIPDEHNFMVELTDVLVEKAGRIIYNGVPTGVEVCEAMTHGGPYPASTDARFTAVGHHAIRRWLRPVTFQDYPADLLPFIEK